FFIFHFSFFFVFQLSTAIANIFLWSFISGLLLCIFLISDFINSLYLLGFLFTFSLTATILLLFSSVILIYSLNAFLSSSNSSLVTSPILYLLNIYVN